MPTTYVVQPFELKRKSAAALPASHLKRLRTYGPLAAAIDDVRKVLGASHIEAEPRRHAGPAEGAALAAILAFAAAGGEVTALVEHLKRSGSPPEEPASPLKRLP